MNANHWSGCTSSAVTERDGHTYCKCCGCALHHPRRLTDAVESGVQSVPAAGRPRDVTGSPKEAPDA